MIEDLEKELAVERARRAEMNKRFDEQVKEFAEEQKQIHDLKTKSKKIEQGKLDRRRENPNLDGDLD